MPNKYFENFNIVRYAGENGVNIMQRGALLTNVIQNPFLFYPYDITNGERPDQLADRYYNDQFMSWAIYMANGIVDPYYDWYLTEEEFNEYLLKKYQVETIYELQQQIKFYRHNWPNADDISVSSYEALIAQNSNLIKYWEPVYNGSARPLRYRRAQKDWVVTTNNIITFYKDKFYAKHADGTKDYYYAPNERIEILFDDVVRGHGQVLSITDTELVVCHTSGFVVPGVDMIVTDSVKIKAASKKTTSTIYLPQTGQYYTASFLMEVTADSWKVYEFDKGRGKDQDGNPILDRIISLDEVEYWEPISVYDWENERNERNKSIRVLDSAFAPQIAKELKNVLK